MMKKLQIVRVLLRLGISNLVRVGWYRFTSRLGFGAVFSLSAEFVIADFYSLPKTLSQLPARNGWSSRDEAFGIIGQPIDRDSIAPPSWYINIINGKSAHDSSAWFRIPDFAPEIGDIKGIWETSRFDWVVVLAQHAARGDEVMLARLNLWLIDWCEKNPPYFGVNWKCGQEASIRVMHLLLAAYLLDQVDASGRALIRAVAVHLRRIFPTIRYAVAQDNNHATSEAAALFMGGSWLERLGVSEGVQYKRLGRKWLENRARRLILSDGSFSQYSVNYHRLMLDTYSWAERWREVMGESEFSPVLYKQLRAAADWLANFVVSSNGDTPNFGANDGARLIPLTDTDYRDFRPSVQLATTIFHGATAYPEAGDYDLPLAWLKLDKPSQHRDFRASRDYPDGGVALIRDERSTVLLRYPVFRFRPSQSDLLHVDLWVNQINLLKDAGTYSYNSGDEWQDYFGSAAAHNTIQFDGRDQMPRLSRFLFGAWPRTRNKVALNREGNTWYCRAGYRDWRGAEHTRALSLMPGLLLVEDRIQGFQSSATLRWRLATSDWSVTDDGVQGPLGSIKVSSDSAPIRLALVEGQESLYYSQKQPVPVLEVTVNQSCHLFSEIRFKS